MRCMRIRPSELVTYATPTEMGGLRDLEESTTAFIKRHGARSPQAVANIFRFLKTHQNPPMKRLRRTTQSFASIPRDPTLRWDALFRGCPVDEVPLPQRADAPCIQDNLATYQGEHRPRLRQFRGWHREDVL